jgi:hypothetical protein
MRYIMIAKAAVKTNKRERRDYSEDDMWKLVLHIHQDMQLIAYLLCGILFALGDASPSSMRISPTSRPRAVSEPPIVHGCNVACLRCLAGRRSGHACRIPLQRAPLGTARRRQMRPRLLGRLTRMR